MDGYDPKRARLSVIESAHFKTFLHQRHIVQQAVIVDFNLVTHVIARSW